MSYKTSTLKKQIIKAIEDNKLIFIEDIIAHIPCSKTTFYEHFPNEEDTIKEFKELLAKNKIDLKVSMRSKWYKSDNPTLQMGLYKLISTDEERKNLSMVYNDHVSSDKSMSPKTMQDWYDPDRNKK